MGAGIRIALAVVTLIAQVGSTSYANPRACSAHAGGPLRATDDGVYRYPSAVNDNNGNSISFEVFSLGQPVAPAGKNLPKNLSEDEIVDMCLRYELKNTSLTHDIVNLRWPDVDLEWYDFPIEPGEQPPGWLAPRENVLASPRDYKSTIGAFRKKKASVRALFAVRYDPVRGSATEYLTPDKMPRTLAMTLLGENLGIDAVPAVSTPDSSKFDYRTLAYQFSPTHEITVTTVSSMSFVEGRFIINYKISAPDQVEVAVPLLFALAELQPQPLVDAAIDFAKSLDSFRNSLFLTDFELALEVKPADSEFGRYSVFVVEHPMTVRTARGEACVMQKAYSPVPVHISEQKCDLDQEIINNWQ